MSAGSSPRWLTQVVPKRTAEGKTGALVAGDGVLVDDDADGVEQAGEQLAAGAFAAGGLDTSAVDEDDVSVGAAVGDGDAFGFERVGQGAGVVDDAALQRLELVGGGELEGDGLAGDGVEVRPALLAGEDGGVDPSGHLAVGGEAAGAARATERLVRGEVDDVGVADRVRDDAARDEPGGVSDVGAERGSGLVGDRPEGGPVEVPGEGAEAGDDEARSVIEGQLAHPFIVDLTVSGHAVGDDVVVLAGAVDGGAVRQVTAAGQGHAQDGAAGLDAGFVDGVVGGGAGEGLHVGVDRLGGDAVVGEERGDTPLSDGLDEVGVLAAAVVAAIAEPGEVRELCVEIGELLFVVLDHPQAWVAFGVDVGEGRGDGLAHSLRADALRRDEDELVLLSEPLFVDDGRDEGVDVPQGPLLEELV